MKIESGMNVVVTGAASGIGLAISQELAESGCNIALIDINQEALLKAEESIKKHNVKCKGYLCDISDYEKVNECTNSIIYDFASIDILVNNAGVVVLGSFEDTSIKDMKWLTDINVWGVINCTKAFLPHLKKNEQSHIVNMASSAAIFAQQKRSAYSFSKAAISSLTQCLRKELKEYGIGVSGIYPGIIKTNISKNTKVTGELKSSTSSPTGGAHPPELVAKKTLKAINKNKARAFAGSEVYFLDFGMRLMPVKFDELLDKYL